MNVNNLPLTNAKNTPLVLEAQDFVPRSYTNSNQIIDTAIDEYKKHGKGLTYVSLQDKGLAKSKRQAQNILKYHLSKRTLFTLSDKQTADVLPFMSKVGNPEEGITKEYTNRPHRGRLTQHYSFYHLRR